MMALLEYMVSAVEAVQRWLRRSTGGPDAGYLRVHTAEGDVVVKLVPARAG